MSSVHEAGGGSWDELAPVSTARGATSLWLGPAVGVSVAALLVWRGHVPAALVLVSVVVGVTLARRWSPSFDRRLASVLAAVTHAVGVGLSWVLLGLLMVVVVLPVWAVTRLLRWDVMDPARDRGSWVARRLRPWQHRLDQGFADERHHLRGRAQAHAAAVVVVPLLVVALLAFPLRDSALRLAGRLVPGHLFIGGSDEVAPVLEDAPTDESLVGIPPPTGTSQSHNPTDQYLAHHDAPWAAEYFREIYPEHYTYDGYLSLRMHDLEGRYVNVANRERRSYVPPGGDEPDALDVWFLGSSAMFGIGERDLHTIPSEVARLSAAAGIPVHVHNFGVPTYQGWQDAMLLAQLLTERDAPDLVITYEGYNDITHFLPPDSPTQVVPQFAYDIRDALVREGATLAGASGDVEDPVPRTTVWSPQNAANVYNRGARVERDLAGAHGVPVVQFLQPSLWTRDLPVDDATLANIGADRAWHDSYEIGWNQSRELMAVDGVIDLGDCLDDLDQIVYFDDVHTNEAGGRAVAVAMFAQLRPTLESLQ